MLQIIDDRIRALVPELATGYRLGTVTTASPLAVTLDGDPAPWPSVPQKIATYTPVLNDRVLALKVGRTYTVMGKVV